MRFYTLILSLICIIMFVLQLAIPGFTEALVLNQESFVQPYRFISAVFLHGGLGHLTLNLFALILFGLILEKVIGSEKFLLIFFVSGIGANLISVNFYNSSLGASGAIMGIIGALTFAKPKLWVWAFGVPMPLFLAAILWGLVDIAGIFIPDNIGNIAHLSGIAFGLILGAIFRQKRESYSYVRKVNVPEDYARKWEDNYMR